MRGSVRLGKIFGIPIGLHISWFLIFVVYTAFLSLDFRDTTEWSIPHCWALGTATCLLLFASVLTHELSHSVIAIRNGVPVKSITLFIFGGVARISKESSKPSTEFCMAIAGPLCSFILAGFFAFIWWLSHNHNSSLGEVTGWLAWINGSLAVFNLIPGFPLDGGRVLRSIIWAITHSYRRATNIASKISKGLAYVMIGGGVVLVLVGNWYSGIWLALIGWLLNNFAGASNRQAEVYETLKKFTVRDIMSYPFIPGELNLRQLVQTYILSSDHRYFLVALNDGQSGIITVDNIKKVPESEWDSVKAIQAMTPLNELQSLQSQENALTALQQMDEAEIDHIVVAENGKAVGLLVREEMMRFIQTRNELGI